MRTTAGFEVCGAWRRIGDTLLRRQFFFDGEDVPGVPEGIHEMTLARFRRMIPDRLETLIPAATARAA